MIFSGFMGNNCITLPQPACDEESAEAAERIHQKIERRIERIIIGVSCHADRDFEYLPRHADEECTEDDLEKPRFMPPETQEPYEEEGSPETAREMDDAIEERKMPI